MWNYHVYILTSSLGHPLLGVPAVPLGLPLQVEHARPRRVAVSLRPLEDNNIEPSWFGIKWIGWLGYYMQEVLIGEPMGMDKRRCEVKMKHCRMLFLWLDLFVEPIDFLKVVIGERLVDLLRETLSRLLESCLQSHSLDLENIKYCRSKNYLKMIICLYAHTKSYLTEPRDICLKSTCL